ncbi:MAG: adenylate/guanylate cyclase domain-containing protein, partial [Pseudomonadota bacterium]
MNDKVQGEGTSSDVSGESRQLQLVFVDLVGSTELSSTMEAEDFAALLLMFQDLSRRIFSSFGGQVSNVMGDGLLIYFGYPQAHENDAERAVRASLNLIAALRQLHSHDVSLSARVGIHSGTVVIGDDASGGGAIFGEAVNVAARIEGAAEAGTVLVSDPILAQLRDKYVAQDQGEHNLRGLRDLLRLHRVVRPRSAHFAPTITPAQLFGRDEQRAQLNNLWDRACRDGPLAVTVMGEPGMGKTSLLSAFHS